eukprot:scaffold6901_cov166-Skeletonema_dohrnii-CCMP3373.AAC.2
MISSRAQAFFYICYCLLSPLIAGPALLHIVHSFRTSVPTPVVQIQSEYEYPIESVLGFTTVMMEP